MANFVIGAIIGGGVSAAINVATQLSSRNEFSVGSFLKDVAVGAALGAVTSGASAISSVAAKLAINAASGAVQETIDQAYKGKGFDVSKIAAESLFSGVVGVAVGAGGGKLKEAITPYFSQKADV